MLLLKYLRQMLIWHEQYVWLTSHTQTSDLYFLKLANKPELLASQVIYLNEEWPVVVNTFLVVRALAASQTQM